MPTHYSKQASNQLRAYLSQYCVCVCVGKGSPLFTATLGKRNFPVFHSNSSELFMRGQEVCIEGTKLTYFNGRKPDS